jgi:hypothetical protein
MSGQSARVSVGFFPIPTHPPSRPDAPAEDSDLPLHRLVGPEAPLCACGPAEQGRGDLPARHPGSGDTRATAIDHANR